ncbi:phosphoadenosine phosphosulfate reductase [Klebsiella oxytoca]|uniref:phosphoadenosine phosphosulfate reductase n=1 Tax=Klebsiella oxytoca TaxID=571 RepID=UPI001B3350E5|nr:DUF3440 domain-containing protein [Klebsiella oxytoca]EJM1007871.1 DUF3440 domain-containing protein [Klebsiella oxytoca]EKQ7242324.1 DUF3440 domain-containing protein [Klebsiella oxytoca]WBD76949.1 DUF3440 domain-containing protein [Klebsiella oxytoca]HBC8620093.1 DUF3440 domain-containing protein [Klebsiella oxytoca]
MRSQLSGQKIATGVNVLEAAQSRINWIFDTFSKVCLSFSGGKDSTVLFHLLADEARRRKRKFGVLFIDWEVQFQATIQHVSNMEETYRDCVEQFYWIAVPLTTESGVSQLQPTWTAWEPGKTWVRQPPETAITDTSRFPFYKAGMTFEAFIPAFNSWVMQGKPGIVLTGIRADESLNRFLSINSQKKLRYADDIPWTTASPEGFYYTGCPLYDWHVTDIWTYTAKNGLLFNPVYDLMYQAGVPLSRMRICEPFGPEQRRGLWLYHILEPDTWALACTRVSGAHCGALYSENRRGRGFYSAGQRDLPPGHSWKSYAFFLLDSMPEATAEHYRNKIAVYLRWYQTRGFPQDIPDAQDKDTGSKDIPSWRRICRVLLRNDYWCRGLSFSPTQSANYQRYLDRMRSRRTEWQIMSPATS